MEKGVIIINTRDLLKNLHQERGNRSVADLPIIHSGSHLVLSLRLSLIISYSQTKLFQFHFLLFFFFFLLLRRGVLGDTDLERDFLSRVDRECLRLLLDPSLSLGESLSYSNIKRVF